MSLNIQTATGLLEIGGKVTKEKVISALGYEPANKTHVEDTDVHVSTEDRQKWDNKSDFSGAYADLIDAPSITENNSGSMVIADENGNIIMQVDENGVATTNINTKTIKLNGEDLGEKLDELESMSLPNILDNESGDLTISDESGNAIVKIDENGLETTTVKAKNAIIGGIDIETRLNEHKEEINGVSGNLTAHTSNSTVHITADERTLWNNKSDFSGDYNDLTNAPDIKEDSSGEVVYADESGNVIAKIGENGFETTRVIANTVIAGGANVGSHVGNADIHITSAERTAWNAKADTTYVDTKVASLVNSAPEALNTLDELAAALGDDANFATTVTNSLAAKAAKTDLESHTGNTTAHITSAERTAWNAKATTNYVDEKVDSHVSNATVHITATERSQWNAKSNFSGDYNDLTNAPDIKEDGSGNLVIADDDGNIIFRSSPNGFETTTLTAQTVTVGDIDVETSIVELRESVAGKAASSHNHTITASASDDDVVVLTGSNGTNKVTYSASHATSGVTAGTYKSVTVNKHGHVTAGTNPTTLSGYGITDAASKTHIHAISDITNLQTTLNDKVNSSTLSNYYTKAEIDSLELITIADIDAICNANI